MSRIIQESDSTALHKLCVGLIQTTKRTLKPTPKIRVDQWADTYRRLGNDSDMQGPFRVSTVEVARGPFAAVTEPGVRELTCVGPTQLFKTTTCENAIGYFMHMDPCPILLYQPKEDAARAFAKKKLIPMIEATPALRNRTVVAKGRDPDATLLYRKFTGGDLTISSVGSSTNLAMISARIVILDEIDKYVDTVEGDPLGLAQKRATKYRHNSLLMYTCSPTTGSSRIMSQYRKSDQRKPMIRCPHCDERQVLEWGGKDTLYGVKWSRDEDGKHDPTTALYHCRACGGGIDDSDRLRALRDVKWFQTRKFTCCGEGQDPLENDKWYWDEEAQCHKALCIHCGKKAVRNRHAGFWASNLYSPFRTMEDMARSWLEAQDSPTKLRTFINTELAMTFDDVGEELDPESLRSRKEVFTADVPDDAHVIIATMDTQDDRLEVMRSAVNLMTEEMWILDHTEFPGDTGSEEVWLMADEFLKQKLYRRDGVAFVPAVVGVDIQGHRRDIAHRFVHRRVGRGFYALVGKAERNGQRSDIWPGNPSRRNKLKLPVYNISVNAAKDLAATRLSIADPSRKGYIHFSDSLREETFDQLTSEQAVPKNIGGTWVRLWQLRASKVRNEAWDLLVYTYAMIRCLQMMPPGHLFKMFPPKIDKENTVSSKSEIVKFDKSKKNTNSDKTEQEPHAEKPVKKVRKVRRGSRKSGFLRVRL